MAYSGPNAWYCNYGNGSSTGWFGVAAWATGTVTAAGKLIRQLATPTVGSERVFVCIVAGTTHATTEPTWVVTKGAKTTDNTVTWQECTGQPGVNGDISAANCPVWTVSSTPALGFIIYDSVSTALQICTTSGAGGAGAAPAFSATAGVTTNDASAVWTSLGLASGFAGWSAPLARIGNAFATNWMTAGNTLFVGDNHAETQATAISFLAPGTPALPNQIWCVDRTVSVPPGTANLKTTATLTCTGGSNTTCGTSGYGYFYGLSFIVGTGSSALNLIWQFPVSNASNLIFEQCSFQMGSSAAGGAPFINFGSTAAIPCKVTLINCTMKFAHASCSVGFFPVEFIWKNTSTSALLAGSAVPTNMFRISTASAGGSCTVDGLDLSAVTAGSTIFNCSVLNANNFYGLLNRCKLASGVTLATTPLSQGGVKVDLINCDNAGTNYQQQRYRYEGTLTQDTTVVRTGGASDGTTPISHKVITTANSSWYAPFLGFPLAIWNTVTGTNRVVTRYGIANAAALPNNDDVWMEVEYLGSASSPQASYANNTKANGLATGTPLTADTSAWDSLVTARANTTAYVVGNTIKVASNPGRVFFCTTSGTSAGSEPGGYAGAVDGGSVTDNTAIFRAGVRFSMAVTLSTPQPAQAGPIYVATNVAKVSSTFWVDPLINLS